MSASNGICSKKKYSKNWKKIFFPAWNAFKISLDTFLKKIYWKKEFSINNLKFFQCMIFHLFFHQLTQLYRFTNHISILYPSLHPPIHPSIHPSIHTSTHPLIQPPTHPLIRSSIHPSTNPSTHSPVNPPIHADLLFYLTACFIIIFIFKLKSCILIIEFGYILLIRMLFYHDCQSFFCSLFLFHANQKKLFRQTFNHTHIQTYTNAHPSQTLIYLHLLTHQFTNPPTQIKKPNLTHPHTFIAHSSHTPTPITHRKNKNTHNQQKTHTNTNTLSTS